MEKHWLVMETGPNGKRAPYRARVASAGRYLPPTRLTTDELMATTAYDTGIDLERLTGVRERRVSDGSDDSLTLSAKAALDCLERSGRSVDSVEVIISCSITKFRDGLVQQIEPSMSGAVAHAIGATSAMTFDLSNACAGMMSGVTVLNDWIRQGLVERGLVVSGEYISSLGTNAARHVRDVMSHELACLTLGDAGAALLLERAPEGAKGITVAGFTTVADYSRLCLAYQKGDDPGVRMFTDGRTIQQLAITNTPVLLQEVLDAADIKMSDIDHVITHQTSSRAIVKGMAAFVEALGDAPRHDAVITVDRYGNTASTSHTVAFVEELESGRINPGETFAMIVLASGLEIGFVLLNVDEELLATHGDNH
jgi:3-oxoacyl-[acyl-carrier-protein] synthase III